MKGVKFRDLNSKFTLVEFDNAQDKAKMLRKGPWAFERVQ